MDIGIVILGISALSVGAILAGAAGQKIDAPILLIFLLVGMLAGREGPGGVSLDASQTVLVWGSAALASILFEGGLRTEARTFSIGVWPGLTLALLGTILTAVVLAPIAHIAFGLGWTEALLLGAIVSSTDAAAVFALAATGLRMPIKVRAVLEVESGLNDPIAIFLVIGLASSLALDPMSATDWAGSFIAKLSLGTIVGIGMGHLVPRLLTDMTLPQGLLTILVAGFGFMAFGLAETVGGSGFLAIYLTGLTMARTAPDFTQRAAGVMDGLAWLAQTGLFLVLGLLVTPSLLADVALPAFLLSLALILLARPIGVVASLLPFRFRSRDMAFVSWAGLRGATPVFLGLIPAAIGVENGSFFVSAATVVVLLSLVIQGWTAPLVGRALKVTMAEDGTSLDRGAMWARLGAVGASIVVGAWFASVLAPPPGDDPDLMAPETMAELRDGLEDAALIPTRFPTGFSSLPLDERRPLFIATLAQVVEATNQRIETDRVRLKELAAERRRRGRLSLEEEAEAAQIARRYGLRLTTPRALLDRIDVIPPRLAIAQAALATGWGSAGAAVEANAVYGRRRDEGFSSLITATQDLASLYAAHEDFGRLRAARVAARRAERVPTAEELAPLIGAYAREADIYLAQIAELLRTDSLAQPLPQPGPPADEGETPTEDSNGE
ncbi:cell volume regulation protein CvrA [Parvularcula bermudensis HTCC2503]|uniref:Cell volume regulation protein CvrA n=1 Tax=Parvularcula bermudensis (strain ATCC BAA-594 / HTCC2503 / KCTC 12087) TaxID=314260 RepID=E0TE36_PARBH|nr:potassium/proton antiporter [Parvularcula bermudensis]ADM08857.1 cell volume regulation protein CvrA [Parvularcula bermudensis HTCC2503]